MANEDEAKAAAPATEEKETSKSDPQDKPEETAATEASNDKEKEEEEKVEDTKKDEKQEEKNESKTDEVKEETKEEKEGDKKDEIETEENEDKEEPKAEDKEEAEGESKEDDKKEETEESKTEEAVTTPTPKKRGRKKKGEITPKTMGLPSSEIAPPLSSGRRERKSATRLSPELVETPSKKDFSVKQGRGVALESIENVKAKIKATKKDDLVLRDAHSLIFSMRGRPKQNQIKQRLLQFSGYLPVVKEGAKPEETEHDDEETETKMSIKAFKLTVAQLKSLAALFDIQTEALDKESLVDSLLDFLGAPDAKLTRGPGKKGPRGRPKASPKKRKSTNGEKKSPAKKKKAAEKKSESEKDAATDETEEEESASDDDNDMDVDKPTDSKMPSDAQLKKWVKAYVGCFNLDKATTKHAIDTASEKFGVDMNSKKAKIKMLLADELS